MTGEVKRSEPLAGPLVSPHLSAFEGCARTVCPDCGKQATVWFYVQRSFVTPAAPGDPLQVTVTGLLTDLTHDKPTDCGSAL